MIVSAPYFQIKGHPIDLCPENCQVYSDEFKHVLVYYYVSACTDERYNNVRITVAGKGFITAKTIEGLLRSEHYDCFESIRSSENKYLEKLSSNLHTIGKYSRTQSLQSSSC